MVNPMLSPTAVTSPMCPGYTKTLLLCRACSINHQEFAFHQDHIPLQGPVPGSHRRNVDDLQNTGATSTTQPYSATAAKVVAKLLRKVRRPS